jgi:hypothetical protein
MTDWGGGWARHTASRVVIVPSRSVAKREAAGKASPRRMARSGGTVGLIGGQNGPVHMNNAVASSPATLHQPFWTAPHMVVIACWLVWRAASLHDRSTVPCPLSAAAWWYAAPGRAIAHGGYARREREIVFVR